MQLDDRQRELIELSMMSGDEALVVALEAYRQLTERKGSAVTMVIMHALMTREGWTLGKLAILLIAAYKRITELEKKLNGEAPF